MSVTIGVLMLAHIRLHGAGYGRLHMGYNPVLYYTIFLEEKAVYEQKYN